MANILKQSKRSRHLPRVINGLISVNERYAEQADAERAGRERGTMPPMMYTLDVWSGQGNERVEYQLQLTEDEVLRVTGDWLGRIANQRARERARVTRTA